jgi:hypothetical protein
MCHGLDAGDRRRNGDGLRPVLKDHVTLEFGILVREASTLVAEAAANVYKDHLIVTAIFRRLQGRDR